MYIATIGDADLEPGAKLYPGEQWNVATLMQIFAVRPDLLEEFERKRAAQPSPDEAEREALTLALRALEDAGSMWMKSGDVGRRLAAIDAIRAALSRKETPHASD